MGSPPLARGILILSSLPSGILGITPACAGNTVVKQVADNMFEDHPRLRGEYMFQNSAYGNKWGSPPLARGILDTMGDIEFPIGITPACAGNTDAINGCDYVVGDHPRLRGEYYRL